MPCGVPLLSGRDLQGGGGGPVQSRGLTARAADVRGPSVGCPDDRMDSLFTSTREGDTLMAPPCGVEE
ncbi:unnamed protein product [Menidia menidia]|uniref:(Atlantic silverside) hypothetical protein n=1 Tax=Menidia menidia TaxID=238744 RepID=A0A8S4B0Q7_9TELE|nr:unnamed protein product [Menidia menidia]